EVPGLARFRANVFFNQQGMAAVFRTIPTKILTLVELGMPPILKEMCKTRRGLILVTGPTGSGKSTTLAAMIDEINSNREASILTIEDPIEFVHPVKKCKITQREVHRDTHSFKASLRSAMRQDPDIILVGEMRDYETISLALTAAEMGVLVFGTLHTNSAAKTIDRIINVYPTDERENARGALAATIKGIVAQQLSPTKDGKGRCAAVEILTYDKSLPNLIRTGKVSGINSLIETSAKFGMQTMDHCLMRFIEEGRITAEQAYLKANDKKKFQPLMDKELAGGQTPDWEKPKAVAP
ncbi:MAG TPA: PilT/PilU family type 4a pilus ATPase, partial [bacterium]